jgi:hypothetical protein
MTLFELLQHDHQTIRRLLDHIERMPRESERARGAAYLRLTTKLAAHSRVEEALFYGPLRDFDESRSLALEAHEEHAVHARLLDEMAQLTPDDEVWCAKFAVLKTALERHLDHEEGEMFELARRLLGVDRARALGQEMQAAQRELAVDEPLEPVAE